MSDRYIEYMRLDEIPRAVRNPKGHDAKTIRASVERHGFVESPTIDERTGRLVAGHGRLDDLETARANGQAVPAGIRVDDDGRWLVPVQRGWASVNDAEAEAYLLTSNQSSIAGGWDNHALAPIIIELQAGPGLAGVGFTDDDIDDVFARASHAPPPVTGDPDEAPPLADDAHTQPGDLWLCGPHRVLCGDSRDANAYATVLAGEQAHAVWTDPPYGVAYEGGGGLTIEGDGRDLDDLYHLLNAAFTVAVQHTRPGAAWYVAGPTGPNGLIFGTVLHNLGIWRQTLVWVKDRFVLGRSDYHYRHELIYEGDTPTEPAPAPETQEPTSLFYGWRPGRKHRAPTERTQDSVWEVPRPSASKDHPTMKPVALIAKALEISTLRGQLVLDPFGGSGSTMAAAAVTGRRSALIELDPRYVDVIVRRWIDLTGLPATHAVTGEPFPLSD